MMIFESKEVYLA